MVLPIIAAAAATAAAQYYNNQQNRDAQGKILKGMRDSVSGLELPSADPAIYDDPRVSGRIDPSLLNYLKYSYQGDYNPEVAAYAREVDPTLVQESANAKFGRDAQVEALRKFQGNIASGRDLEFDAKRDQAATSANAAAQSRMQSILQDAARRGTLGANSMLGAQMQGASDAMSQGALQSQMAAVESQKNLLQQQRDAATMGRNLAADENQLAAQNASILNAFNERSSRAYQQYLNNAAQTRNNAQLRNLDARQQLENANIDISNRQTADQYRASQAEREYANKIATQKQGLQQTNFANNLAKINAGNGVATQIMGNNNNNAQANAGMIQGIGNSFAGYFQDQAQDARDLRREDRADARMKYLYGAPPQPTQPAQPQSGWGDVTPEEADANFKSSGWGGGGPR